MLFSNFSLKHLFRQFVESHLLSTHKKSGKQTSSLKIFSSFILVFKKFSNFSISFCVSKSTVRLKIFSFCKFNKSGKNTAAIPTAVIIKLVIEPTITFFQISFLLLKYINLLHFIIDILHIFLKFFV